MFGFLRFEFSDSRAKTVRFPTQLVRFPRMTELEICYDRCRDARYGQQYIFPPRLLQDGRAKEDPDDQEM